MRGAISTSVSSSKELNKLPVKPPCIQFPLKHHLEDPSKFSLDTPLKSSIVIYVILFMSSFSCYQILRVLLLHHSRRQPALLRGHGHCQDTEDALQGEMINIDNPSVKSAQP